jgi:hypothetical protein
MRAPSCRERQIGVPKQLFAAIGTVHEGHRAGCPDETFAANAVESERKSVAEAAVFVGIHG